MVVQRCELHVQVGGEPEAGLQLLQKQLPWWAAQTVPLNLQTVSSCSIMGQSVSSKKQVIIDE